MLDPRHLLRVTLESVHDAVVVTDMEGRVLEFNRAAELLTGLSAHDVQGKPIEAVLELRESGSDEPVANPACIALRDGVRSQAVGHVLLMGKGGRRIAVTIDVSPLLGEPGSVNGCVAVLRDVGEAVQIAQRMAYQAQHDPLTGLPNRILLVDRTEQAARIADRQGDQLAIIFIELDRVWESAGEASAFGEFREHFAAIADDLLREVAARLTAALRESDTVCRLGGAEFVLMLPGLKTIGDIEVLAIKLVGEITRHFVAGAQTLTASCSIGISLYPQDASDVHTLMRVADGAMYQARGSGSNRYKFAGVPISTGALSLDHSTDD